MSLIVAVVRCCCALTAFRLNFLVSFILCGHCTRKILADWNDSHHFPALCLPTFMLGCNTIVVPLDVYIVHMCSVCLRVNFNYIWIHIVLFSIWHYLFIYYLFYFMNAYVCVATHSTCSYDETFRHLPSL